MSTRCTESAKKGPRTLVGVFYTLLEGAAGGKCATERFWGLTGGHGEQPLGFTPVTGCLCKCNAGCERRGALRRTRRGLEAR